MSAQAVLSMIAPGPPANPRGSSDDDGVSGFGGLLAAVLSPEGEAGAVSPDASTTPLTAPPVMPAVTGPKAPEGDAEPQVLPDAVDANTPEPQVLPGTTAIKDAEPPVLPVAPTEKGVEPQVLPGGIAGKDAGRQVLPGPAAEKSLQPQILPGTGAGEGVTATAPSGPVSGPPRPDTDGTQTRPVQPLPPPLRALAERTSEPSDDSGSAPSPTVADAKTAPATSPVSAPADQPAKSGPQAVLTPAASQGDRSAPAPEEAPSTNGPAAGPSEAAAPARDHSLSMLSRASIDATAQIAAQIQRRLEGRSTRFEIALRPAELGRVDVKLDIDAEGRLAARLAFDNPAAATDLRGRVDDLRRQLEAAGFDLADDAFEFAERDSGSSAFDRGQDARHGSGRAFAAAARLKSDIDVAQPPQWLALSLSPAGVDMKV